MNEEKNEAYEAPQLAINRVYTRRGDSGQTSLVGGDRLPKDALRIDCYGTVDELNSVLGLVLVSARTLSATHPRLARLAAIVRRVQHELFNAGSVLATPPEQVGPRQPRVTTAEVTRLEQEIDELNEELAPLRSFVLPGGSRLSVELHLGRTVCRRVERLCVTLQREEPATDPLIVTYLNRLSDALFVWSRWADAVQGAEETLWDPNLAASG
ncbi:MAG: cob(I)yrinic acid a,c-diamide adenosyltransferase [Deltaproteobacteria bacterium]|nr:cob(I)yrinic acid a,c-diamide adenosyltransferase [Deltaproteobacteria bacterium]